MATRRMVKLAYLENGQDLEFDVESSPEYLVTSQPVRDPYSSDDNLINMLKLSDVADQPTNKKQDKPIRLPKTINSANMTGVDVLFFFNLDYTKYPNSPVDLTNSSPERILEAMFKFIYNGTDAGDKTCTFNELKATEIYQRTLDNCPILLWMSKNDKIDYKICTDKQLKSNIEKFQEMKSKECRHVVANKIFDAIRFTEIIKKEYDANGLNDHNQSKVIFRLLANLVPCNCSLRYRGEAESMISYRVSEEIASDISPKRTCKVFKEGNRDCYITVSPASVFDESDIAKIAVEVYAAPVDRLSTVCEDDPLFQVEKDHKSHIPKPTRDPNAILNKEYRRAANTFLQQFVPKDCGDNHCMDMMLGKHLLQLIALGTENRVKVKDRTKEIVGLFLKNEYLYISKLVINDQKLESYNPGIIPHRRLPDEEGKISFANWKIDLTKANHRIALVAFLLQFF